MPQFAQCPTCKAVGELWGGCSSPGCKVKEGRYYDYDCSKPSRNRREGRYCEQLPVGEITYVPTDDEYDSDDDSVVYNWSDIKNLYIVALLTTTYHYPLMGTDNKELWAEKFVRKMKLHKITTIVEYLERAPEYWLNRVIPQEEIDDTIKRFIRTRLSHSTTRKNDEPS